MCGWRNFLLLLLCCDALKFSSFQDGRFPIFLPNKLRDVDGEMNFLFSASLL